MVCPNCGAHIDGRSNFCNRCGAAQNRNQESGMGDQENRYGPREYRSDQQNPSGNYYFDFSNLNDKKYLLIALACFGWALVKGVPALFGLLRFLPNLASWPWSISGLGSPFSLVSAIFPVGLHFVAPLIVGLVLYRKHRDEQRS